MIGIPGVNQKILQLRLCQRRIHGLGARCGHPIWQRSVGTIPCPGEPAGVRSLGTVRMGCNEPRKGTGLFAVSDLPVCLLP
jgi:hypothetical protein